METQLRLTIRILNSRIEQLEAEMATLKANIEYALLQEILRAPTPKRSMSVTAKENLEYYHHRKNSVLQELSEKHGLPPSAFSWTCVKKYTDLEKQVKK